MSRILIHNNLLKLKNIIQNFKKKSVSLFPKEKSIFYMNICKKNLSFTKHSKPLILKKVILQEIDKIHRPEDTHR